MLIPNLIFVYHTIVASENLLRVALAQTPEGTLKAYFARHLEEEAGHARWLAEDLKCVDVDVTRTKMPLLAVQMAGSLYYLIYHAHPAALLGYMKVLEGWPNDRQKLAEQGKAYPAGLLRTVNYHLEHDPDHLKELEAIIASLPEHRELIEEVIAMTRNYLYQAADQIRSAGEFSCQAVQ